MFNNLANLNQNFKKSIKINENFFLCLNSQFNLKFLFCLQRLCLLRRFVLLSSNDIKVELKYINFQKKLIQDIKIYSSNERQHVNVFYLQNLMFKHPNYIFIVSTVRGFLSQQEAIRYNLGGFLIAYIIL